MNFVPGVTGKNQPPGTITCNNSSSVTPASHLITPTSLSKDRILLNFNEERMTGASDASPYDKPAPRTINLGVTSIILFNSSTVLKETMLALMEGYRLQFLTSESLWLDDITGNC